MTITRTFKLCLNAGTGSAPYINVNQYDSGEQWLFELYNEDGTRYTPSTGAIIGLKADGHAIMNNGTVDSEGRVVITETEQMTAAAGRSVFELSIDSNTHGTANFIVKAERKPLDEGEMSDSDISMLQEAIDAAEVIEEIIGEGGDPSQRITDAVDDWLEAHPEATTTVQDGAITAPKINTSLWDKLLASEEAIGSVASFDDGADGVPVKSLKVSIDPVQSGEGDPSPTNIRPISGHSSVTVTRTGKNQIDESGLPKTVSGANYISFPLPSWAYLRGTSEDVTLSLKGSLGEGKTRFALYIYDTVNNNALYIGNSQYLTAANNFTIKGKIEYGGGGTIDPTKPLIIRIYAQPYDGTNTSTISGLMLAFGDTEYEPYTGNTYPVSLGQTVYGGSVDLATGVLTVEWAIKDLGSMNWNASPTAHCFYSNTFATAEKYRWGADTEMICSQYKFDGIRGSSPYFGENGTLRAFFRINTQSLCEIYVHDDRYTSAADFKTAMSGVQLAFPLETPTTVQLTPQEVTSLLGVNNISADTGEVEVIYRADTKLYVDKMTAVDNNIIAPTEETFTATRNYTVNDLVIVNDTLYKVTANIANGSAITVNTNVVQTTVAEQLLALA